MVTVESIREALNGVMDPELGRSLVDLGMVKDIQITGDEVSITLALTTLACPLKAGITADVKRAVSVLPGVSQVTVDLVAMSAAERAGIMGGGSGPGKDVAPPPAQQVNRIKKVIAVMSGKGGVGKSLVTGLLAVALAKDGKQVGILDADITGPSIPKMFGLRGQMLMGPLGLLPASSKLGIKAMSINLLLTSEDEPVIWRGPLIGNMITKFWEEVVWGSLDYLLVDLPPGTSDAPLTVLQSLPVAGVIIVSTPQDLTGMVVRKAVRMAHRSNVTVLGVLENMSYFICPDTGKRYEIFGPSRGQEMAMSAEAPLLGVLPIDPLIAKLCDAGLVEDYDAEAYRGLAQAFASVAKIND